MVKADFVHEVTTKEVKNGSVVVHDEFLIHGSGGLSFKYYYKDDKTKEKITGKMLSDGKFSVRYMVNDKKDEKEMSKDELIKEFSKNKALKFVVDYLKTQKGGKKSSRKMSRKGSRKVSKKGSKKGSKKMVYKKKSRKGSRK